MLIVAATTVLIVARDDEIHLPEAVLFLGLWVVYIGVVLTLPHFQKLFGEGPLVNKNGNNNSSDNNNGPSGSRRLSSDSMRTMGEGLLASPVSHSQMDDILSPTQTDGPMAPLSINQVQVASPLQNGSSSNDLPMARPWGGGGIEPMMIEPPPGMANADSGRSRRSTSGGGGGMVADLYNGADSYFGGGGGIGGGNGGNDGQTKCLCCPPGMRDFLTGNVRMEGLDWPEEGGNKPHILALYILELPLSLFRWLTIPSSDGEWDRRRRLWSALCPPLLGLLWLIEFAGDVPSALTSTIAFGGHPAAPVNASNSTEDPPNPMPDGGIVDPSFELPIPPIVVGVGLVFSVLILLFSVDGRPPCWQPVLVIIGFATTIVWLDLIANEMIALIETIGLVLGLPTSFLALTVVAIGNSVGDLVADTASAKEGTVAGARMAIAACFGSPVIMNIVSVGLAFTLRLAKTGEASIHVDRLETVARLGYMLLYLTIISHLIVFPLNNYSAPRWYGIYLFAIYATLIIMSVLMSLPDKHHPMVDYQPVDVQDSWFCQGPFWWVFRECPAVGCVEE